MSLLIAFLLSFVLTSLVGYWIHRAFHRRWSGPSYKAHLNHHIVQYPPKDLFSEAYRSAGQDNTAHFFWLAAIPLIIGIFFFWFFSIISLKVALTIAAGIAASGFIHDYFHDKMHISPCYWERFAFFQRMRKIHSVHHRRMNKNFGIFIFGWDRLFGTFDKGKLK